MDIPVQAMNKDQRDRITQFFTEHSVKKNSQDLSYLVSMGSELSRALQLTNRILFKVLQIPELSKRTVSCHTVRGILRL